VGSSCRGVVIVQNELMHFLSNCAAIDFAVPDCLECLFTIKVVLVCGYVEIARLTKGEPAEEVCKMSWVCLDVRWDFTGSEKREKGKKRLNFDDVVESPTLIRATSHEVPWLLLIGKTTINRKTPQGG